MVPSVYHRLREQLDQYSVGFPSTASGIELRILERLFDEEEAALYLDCSLLLEKAESLSARTGRDPERTAELLESMARKGLLFRLRSGTEAVRYAAVPFVVGCYEFQVGRLDRELSEMVEAYFEEAFFTALTGKLSPLRTIPVNRSIEVAYPVAPYDDAREIVRTRKKIAVAKCLCRAQRGALGQACSRPLEVCFSFGAHAEYYIENGIGRPIGVEEALAILDECERAGLVCQPYNVISPGGMCNCCGDCCGVLRSLRRQPRPAELVVASYRAAVDPERCAACGTCLDRCQMDALLLGEGEDAVRVDPDRCIGCGLCVTTCPNAALRLEAKPEAERRLPAADGKALMVELCEQRGTSLVPLSLRGK